MLFMLLSSFFILSGASEIGSLQPVGKMDEHNASVPDLMSVLASKGNPDVLLKMLENADPAQVDAILLLVKALLSDTELDLETLTTASTNANSAYDSAVSAHGASVDAETAGRAKLAKAVADAVAAQTEGVAKLAQAVADSKQAQTEGEAALSLDVATALGEKQKALGAKTAAKAALDAEEARLLSEIDRLKKVIAVLETLGNNGYELFFRQTAPTYKDKAGWLSTGSASDPNYSRLNTLDDSWKGADGKFQFKIRWPLQGDNYFNEWKQSSNPVTKKSSGVVGYEAVKINRKGCHWGGLEYCTSSYTLLDGSVNHGNWYYAIGSKQKWGKGIPSGCDGGTTVTELYVLKP